MTYTTTHNQDRRTNRTSQDPARRATRTQTKKEAHQTTPKTHQRFREKIKGSSNRPIKTQ